MPPNVAILQNRVQKGGRTQVISRMIKCLNDRDITPDIVTFKSRVSNKDIRTNYNLELDYRTREIFFNPRIPFEWNILFFNWVSSFYTRKYDVLINSNNTLFLNYGSQKIIDYVHFPRKKRNIIDESDIHFPEGSKKSIWDIKKDPFRIAKFLYRFDNRIKHNAILVANSTYTKHTIQEVYDSDSEIIVLPPPVSFDHTEKKEKVPNSVLSLGRISPDKRQLEQLQIAKAVPEFSFTIVGFCDNKAYLDQLEALIEQENIQNVKIKINQPYHSVREIIASSSFFLHTLRNEPFGITTVQALHNGCIPIVHNSGGSKEIVQDEAFTFNTKEEAIELLSHFSKSDPEQLDAYRSVFVKQSATYSSQVFDENFHLILDQVL